MSSTETDIAALKVQVAALQQDVGRLTHNVELLLAQMHQAKGSWATLVVLGSITATLGAAAATVISWFRS
jgi:predicted amidohydrolase